jgi:hypothetical protein
MRSASSRVSKTSFVRSPKIASSHSSHIQSTSILKLANNVHVGEGGAEAVLAVTETFVGLSKVELRWNVVCVLQ